MTGTTKPTGQWSGRPAHSGGRRAVLSALGARISATAMPLLATTGSPADAGLVAAAGTLLFLIAHLPAGPLVDRWNRRRILLTSEALAGLGNDWTSYPREPFGVRAYPRKSRRHP